MMKTYRLLSIDAWADGNCGDCDACNGDDIENCARPNWTWNNWHSLGRVDALPETVEQFWALVYRPDAIVAPGAFYIDDDGYNICLKYTDSDEPLYAVCYGDIDDTCDGDE